MERTKLQTKPLIAILLLSIILTIAPAATAEDIQVNTTGWWHHADLFNASTTPIQHAINNATDGDTILVHDGTYTEQVILNKSLTLRNAGIVEHPAPPIHIPSPILNSVGRPRGGQSSHLTRPPSLTPENASSPRIVAPPDPRDVYAFSESGSTWDPIIFAYGGAKSGGNVSGSEVINVNITGFVIDGEDRCPIGRFTGILCRNVEGEISGNAVKNMTVNDQETFGIAVYGDSDVTISSNTVSDYVRGGIVVNGDFCGTAPDPTALIINNTITGPGTEAPVTWASNGIQIAWGATGTIQDNTVTGNTGCGPDWTGTGILVCGSSHDVAVIENEVYGSEIGIAVIGAGVWGCPGGDNNVVSRNIVRDNEYGISVQMDVHNTSVICNSVMNNNQTGIDVSNFWNYEPTGAGIHHNIIVGNGANGVENYNVYHSINATHNWWGANNGPSGQGSGSGDAVTDNVVYDPWIVLCVNADPPEIAADGISTSTITADMTVNSDGVNTLSINHIPDGTEINLTTEGGSGSQTTTRSTINGKATATLTSSTTPGTATVNASAPPHSDAATSSTTVVFRATDSSPVEVPAMTPQGFLLVMVSLFGLGTIVIVGMNERGR